MASCVARGRNAPPPSGVGYNRRSVPAGVPMSQVLISILSFAFALGVIIFVHESGHLLVAKAFNVRVLTFSLGFGKRLWGFQRGETEYRVSALPLGGYVRLGGENVEEATGDPRDFLSKPRWQRILVYLAG